MSNITQLLTEIKKLSIDDQRVLVKQASTHVNQTIKINSILAARKIKIGDIVSFDAREKGPGIVQIRVDGFTKDGAMLRGEQLDGDRKGCYWTVAASLCKKV
jgi:hypothetical protein